METLILSEAHVYPVKGGQPVIYDRGQKIPLSPTGFLHDREWMVVGPDYNFRSQRDRGFEELRRIETELSDHALTLRDGRSNAKVTIPFNHHKPGEPVDVTIWGDRCRARIEEWGSYFVEKIIGQKCFLVRQEDERLINRLPARADARASFADRYHLHGISRSTVNRLDALLSKGFDIHRPRANLIFSGCEPMEENHWEEIRINGQTLYGVKPCERCSVMNRNQLTGENDPEALTAIVDHFTGANKKPILGENFNLDTDDLRETLQVGSPVEVIRRRGQGWDRPYKDGVRSGRLLVLYRLLRTMGLGRVGKALVNGW